jgi:regulator of PEP synthase PpsR (kinase-PPPase family)
MAKIFAISDGTSTTAHTVARAALVQFDTTVEIERYREVRSAVELRKIIARAAKVDAVIVHTLISADLRTTVLKECRERNVASVDLLGPLLARLEEMLHLTPIGRPGALRPFDAENVQRIEAINYAVKHDDGQQIEELGEAEIVLVGVSRTGKTPLSIFLAYRGWRVANVPLVSGIDLPAEVDALPRKKVVALIADPSRLALLRQSRTERMGVRPQGYANLDHVKREIAYAYEVFDRHRDWPVVDVTNKSIEESAAEIINLIGGNFDE